MKSKNKIIKLIAITAVFGVIAVIWVLTYRPADPNAAKNARNRDAVRIANHLNAYETTGGTRESAENVAGILMNGGIHTFQVAGSDVTILIDPSYWGGAGWPVVSRNEEGLWEAVRE